MGLFLSDEDKRLLKEDRMEIKKKEQLLVTEQKNKREKQSLNELYQEFGIPSDYKLNEKNRNYIVRSFIDNDAGYTSTEMLEIMLNYYLENGWKLYKIFTNIIGVNSSSNGLGINGIGMAQGTNSTIEQTVVIFERVV